MDKEKKKKQSATTGTYLLIILLLIPQIHIILKEKQNYVIEVRFK